MLGSVPCSVCWCSVCQTKVPYWLRLDAVAKVEIIVNNHHLQTPDLKAGIRRERCRDKVVILKESCAYFILIRAIKMFGQIKKSAECCLNDLIFSVFIKLLILHHRFLMQWFWRLSQDPLPLKRFLLFSKGSCPVVYDCSWVHMFWSNCFWDRFFFFIDVILVSLGGISKNNSSWHFFIEVLILLAAFAVILKEYRKNIKKIKSCFSLRRSNCLHHSKQDQLQS